MTRFEFWLKLQIVNEKNVEIKDEAYFYIYDENICIFD